MKPRDISFSTGTNINLIYSHLNNGTLDGEKEGGRWNVPAWEVMCWSHYLWRQGRVLMFPPQYTARFIEDFELQ